MAKAPPSAHRDRIQPLFPALVDYTNDVIYGDLWERKGLSKRDRSLITVAALVATVRPMQLKSHVTRALANGVTREEIAEIVTHMAFYAGWPAGMTAAQTVADIYEAEKK
ncbi:MAG: carboxymuconolactone decarboxylase family protein [Candidatus Lambdaproteobacteria bacterium]|nr:carboxymuconolactone decarboxylase family protein [Candidatus Lambdaproteobacteria bacterium]